MKKILTLLLIIPLFWACEKEQCVYMACGAGVHGEMQCFSGSELKILIDFCKENYDENNSSSASAYWYCKDLKY